MKIEVLGPGCPRCKLLESNVKKAIEDLKLKAELVKVSDISRFVEYGIMSSPALVVDGKVKVSGRVPEIDEIKKWLK